MEPIIMRCKKCGEIIEPQYPLTPDEWHECEEN